MMADHYAYVMFAQSLLHRKRRHFETAAKPQFANAMPRGQNEAKAVFLAKMSHQLRTKR